MDWQFPIGLGATVVSGLLPYVVKNMPQWVTWPGISVGILFILWGLLGNYKIPAIPAVIFIISVAGIVSSIALYLDHINIATVNAAPSLPIIRGAQGDNHGDPADGSGTNHIPPEAKLHYSVGERDAILDFLRKFEAFFRERETPNETIYWLVQRFGPAAQGRNVPRPSQSAELAEKLERYGQDLEADSRSFQKMLDDAKFFSTEISPVVSEEHREIMNFRGDVLRVAFALREAAKIKEENINMLALLAKPLEELDSGYATYYTWISDALQKIESKVREVRTWN
jgi:hypothetical protein